MCGLFAVSLFGPTSIPEIKAKIGIGLDRISHRGPDGSDFWINAEKSVGLGHVRLSIVDVENGSQPMVADDGSVIVFNGEIYNYIELRQELGLSNFKTKSDTEVILHAFRQWGSKCVDYFRGMFSFIIWDARSEDLFFARDRFGIKPFYFYQNKVGDVFFSSEVKGLLPFVEQREICKDALNSYFNFQFYLSGNSLVKGIKELPPAHYGWFKNKHEFQIFKYWDVFYNPDYTFCSAQLSDTIHSLVTNSCDIHMRADVEIGGYVSGGLDSSITASIAQRYKQTQKPFKIFNGRFCEGDSFDESRYARDVANAFNMELYVSDISENDFVNYISKTIYHLDSPIAGPGSFPQFMVSKLVGEKVKVVLGGQGGDEIFGGYARYLIGYLDQCIHSAVDGDNCEGNMDIPFDSILESLNVLKSYKPLIKEFFSEGLFAPLDQRYFRLINRSNSIGPLIADGIIEKETIWESFWQIFNADNVSRGSIFDKMTHFDLKTLLPALLQVEDRMSMAHGVEARVPLLDHPIAELLAVVPGRSKYFKGNLKYLLKSTFEADLPTSILQRKDKMGFPVPMSIWLSRPGKAREFVGDTFATEKAKTRFYLKSKLNVDDVLNTQSMFGRNLWALLSLELWQQQFIDNG